MNLLTKSLELARMVSTMSAEEKYKTADIIREADIARLLHGSTINKELKAVAPKYKGKVKRFLNALGSNPHAMSGVNVLFEKWEAKL